MKELYNTVQSAERLQEVKNDIISDSDESRTDVTDEELQQYLLDLDSSQLQDLVDRLDRAFLFGRLVFITDDTYILLENTYALVTFFKDHPFVSYKSCKSKADQLDTYSLAGEHDMTYTVLIAIPTDLERVYNGKWQTNIVDTIRKACRSFHILDF